MKEETKYPRGKAEFSSFEDSENEQHQRWAKHTPEERLLHLFELMDIFKSDKPHMDETGNEFVLKRLPR